jgi:selenocysteine lyase/cysteine desulfurase
VRALDCDFLACSAYKFFGPHVGLLYGKYDLLDRLPAYKVRPAENTPPHKFQTGTQNHEGIAGVLGAMEYFEWLGGGSRKEEGRRAALVRAMTDLADYERELGAYLIEGLQTINGLRIWGITDPARYERRVPTVSFTLAGWHPRAAAERLAQANIYVWDGNYYALAIMERLGLQQAGGMVRVGLAHYNTRAEVEQLVETIKNLTGF